VIEARQLAKRFGGRAAIEDVSLAVARGEVVGFLGPNGAGKTTTLRILAGVFPPTSGQALIDGHDVVRAPLAARRRLGYAPERPALHLEMTVAGLLDFAAGMKDVGAARARRAAVARRRIGALSKGVRQRVGLAFALVGDPPALLLDEPTAGLDPERRADMRGLIRALGAERAVLVSSHALAEVGTLCDRVVILHRGRVLFADTPARLAARLRPTSRIEVEVAAPRGAVRDAMKTIPGVVRVEERAASHDGIGRFVVESARGHDVRGEIFQMAAQQKWALLELRRVGMTLEEVFIRILAGEEREAAATTAADAVPEEAS